ncbi:hypothetical protein ISS96_02945 [Candidatus Bathyarchaeota archaeon]|nr:hypothetical protein [Candidatus Bathyarchaeota archaeon]
MNEVEIETPVVETRNLGKTYELGKVRVQALKNVNTRIGRSGFVAVRGTSGDTYSLSEVNERGTGE